MTACEDCAKSTESTDQPWESFAYPCAGCEKRMLACMVEVIAAGRIEDTTEEADGTR